MTKENRKKIAKHMHNMLTDKKYRKSVGYIEGPHTAGDMKSWKACPHLGEFPQDNSKEEPKKEEVKEAPKVLEKGKKK